MVLLQFIITIFEIGVLYRRLLLCALQLVVSLCDVQSKSNETTKIIQNTDVVFFYTFRTHITRAEKKLIDTKEMYNTDSGKKELVFSVFCTNQPESKGIGRIGEKKKKIVKNISKRKIPVESSTNVS